MPYARTYGSPRSHLPSTFGCRTDLRSG